jgi:hypothetical protein
VVALHAGKNEAVLAWLGQRTDFTLSPNTHLIWATSDVDGTLLGAIGMGGRMGRTWGSVSIALAHSRAALPLVRAAVDQVFGAWGSAAAYVTIGSRRPDWIRQLINVIGFYQVDRVHGGISPREDLIILKVTPDSCRPWQRELRKLSRARAREAS